ncbi:MAG: LacI family DNA-binding transcriptional regulator [Anaerolineales bacterium]|jgi:DNA-binding LacI/PurR family transcriptional regulator
MISKKRVTINDVAEEAGVSIKTVSRVINNRPDVAPKTRKRVLEVIERLNFRPSKLARGLSQGRSRTIGVVSYGLKYFGPASTLAGVEEESHRLGYTVIWEMLRDSEKDNVDRLLQDMAAQHVDGLFWAAPEIVYDRQWVLQALSRLPFPIVVNISENPQFCSAVTNKNELGGQIATQHLIDQGYKRIGLITGPLNWRESRLRKRGWQTALENTGYPVDEGIVFEGDWTADSGSSGLRILFSVQPQPDAIFVSNDQMALGALWAADQLGLQVPDDVAIVGYDNIPESAYFQPSLTTIHQETFEMGRRAIRELDRLIEANWGEQEAKPKSIEFEPRLIVRESSGVTVPKNEFTKEGGHSSI